MSILKASSLAPLFFVLTLLCSVAGVVGVIRSIIELGDWMITGDSFNWHYPKMILWFIPTILLAICTEKLLAKSADGPQQKK